MDSSVALGSIVEFSCFKVNGIEMDNPTNPIAGGNIHPYSEAESYAFGDTSLQPEKRLHWIKYTNRILICDRNILVNISWQNIYKNYSRTTYDASKNTITSQTNIIGVPSGTTIAIDGHSYRVRLASGGYFSSQSGSTIVVSANEISKVYDIAEEYYDTGIKSWCSETCAYDDNSMAHPANYTSLRTTRGHESNHWYAIESAKAHSDFGFRPVLELIS